MQKSHLWVDNEAHLLHLGRHAFPCDRDVEALLPWQDKALLLSSDTDCLSLWDSDGLLRLTRVGVYPQDMALSDGKLLICGGADVRLHLLSVPLLHSIREFPLPGMPERISLHNGSAYVLTLLTDPEVQSALLSIDPSSGFSHEINRYPGLPGALLADACGLWVAAGEQLQRLRWADLQPEAIIHGFGLIRRLLPHADGVIAVDPLEERAVFISSTFTLVTVPYDAGVIPAVTRYRPQARS